jgi:hypothetical protein
MVKGPLICAQVGWIEFETQSQMLGPNFKFGPNFFFFFTFAYMLY